MLGLAALFIAIPCGNMPVCYAAAAFLLLLNVLSIMNILSERRRRRAEASAEKPDSNEKEPSKDRADPVEEKKMELLAIEQEKLKKQIQSLKDERTELSEKVSALSEEADSKQKEGDMMRTRYVSEVNNSRLFHEIADIISGTQKISDIYSLLTEKLLEEYSVDCAFILSIEKGVFKLKCNRGSISDETVRALEISGLLDPVKSGESVMLGRADSERIMSSTPGSGQTIFSVLCHPMKTKISSKPFGAIGLLNKAETEDFTEDDDDAMRLVSLQAAISIQNTAYVSQMELSNEETMLCLAQALEGRDKYTQGHVDRVRDLSEKLARELELPEDEIKLIRKAATLHDVGKIATPDGILHKGSSLTNDEWKIMKRHSEMSAKILEPISSLPREVIAMVRCHHEHWDGSGYPHGLSKNAIPKGAQIIAVADTFDALTSDRPYRKGMSWETALAKMKRETIGTQFDPKIITPFLLMMNDEVIRKRKRKSDKEGVERVDGKITQINM